MTNRRAPVKSKHAVCRPPVGANRAAWRVNDRGKFVKDDGKAGMVFVVESLTDNTHALIVAPSCQCHLKPDQRRRCPIVKAWAWAAEKYDTASFVERPALAPVQAARMGERKSKRRGKP